MTHQEASRWLYRIYKMIKDNDLRVRLNRKLNRVFGTATVFQAFCEIQLNPSRPWLRKGGLVYTVIHECIHLVDFDLPEEEVCRLEKEIFEGLTDRQLGNLLQRVFSCLRKERS